MIVKRLEGKQGYDYAAQFYPHPAWLYLSTEPEHPMMDHPAVIVAKRLRRESTEHHLAQAEKADADNTH